MMERKQLQIRPLIRKRARVLQLARRTYRMEHTNEKVSIDLLKGSIQVVAKYSQRKKSSKA